MENFLKSKLNIYRNYSNYISLGFFCSVAIELEKLGLRDASYPFDWLITSKFEKVIELIDKRFSSFLNYDNLFQNKNKLNYYLDNENSIQFFHDFNYYESLSKQIESVKEKYKRRIVRFYNDIKQSTLFIRYIYNKEELEYIENNYDYIISVLKKYNIENDIIFIANNDITSKKIYIYNVDVDETDSVARCPIEKNLQLYEYFLNVNYLNRVENIHFYEMKSKNKHKSIIKRIISKLMFVLSKKYHHSKKY